MVYTLFYRIIKITFHGSWLKRKIIRISSVLNAATSSLKIIVATGGRYYLCLFLCFFAPRRVQHFCYKMNLSLHHQQYKHHCTPAGYKKYLATVTVPGIENNSEWICDLQTIPYHFQFAPHGIALISLTGFCTWYYFN